MKTQHYEFREFQPARTKIALQNSFGRAPHAAHNLFRVYILNVNIQVRLPKKARERDCDGRVY